MMDIKLSGKSGVDTLLDMKPHQTLKNLDVKLIEFNPINNMNDDFEEVKNLAENILETGLLEPIVVYMNNGIPRLLSGERRVRAFLYNIEQHSSADTSIPALIAEKPEDLLEEEMTLLGYNEHRRLKEPQLIELVGRYLRIWEQLKSQDRKPKGQQRDWIAMKLTIGQKRAEQYVHLITGKKTENDLLPKQKPIYFEEIKESMEKRLHTKIAFTKNRFTINFKDEEELSRILEMLAMEDLLR